MEYSKRTVHSVGEALGAEQTNLEKSLSVIIDSLRQQNPVLVKDVEDLVSELCRITLLWDEMWLAALMQRQGEVHRYILMPSSFPMFRGVEGTWGGRGNGVGRGGG